jgi:tRNA (cmo5U34)-methyltransferase
MGCSDKQKAGVGNGIATENANWSFNVPPSEFDEHIEKSVPFYKEGHDLIAQISDFFVPNDTVIYDIGTTTGTLVRKILNRHPDRNIHITGIDVIPAMIDYAAQKTSDQRASFEYANALEYSFNKSHLMVLYYTLQFIHPSVRIDLLKKIYESLHWGGGLLIFEKVRAYDARFQDYMTQLYTEFKLQNEFSPEEIINKQKSLKGILEPFSEEGNLTLLKEAGFKDIMPIFKWVCFEGWLVIK